MKLIQTKCTINHENKIEHEENAISEFEYKSEEKRDFSINIPFKFFDVLILFLDF